MPSFFRAARRLVRPMLVGLLVATVCASASAAGVLQSWSERAWDRFFLHRAPQPGVVVVTIDDASLQDIGRWPWDRSEHASLIQRIADGRPAAIGYDVTFAEPQDALNDTVLAQAIQGAGVVVLPVETTMPETTVYPLAAFRDAAATVGHVTLRPDMDGVVRRVARFETDQHGDAQRVFAEQVLRVAGILPTNVPGTVRIAYAGGQGWVASSYVSAADVLQGRVDAAVFTDALVFVGATAPSLHDTVITPVGVMAGVEAHAAIADTLWSERFLAPVPLAATMAFLVLLSLVAAAIALWMRMRWGIPLILLLSLLIVGSASVLFDRGWVLDVVWPLIATFGSFVLVSVERRWSAERERREIKNVFSRYMNPSVVQALLDDPSRLALGGRRREMTVFFSDIRGFTSLSETMKPERLVRVLNSYLDRMTKIVFAHDGVLDKYIGDAVMAFWNAPFDQPDHARRAVATALAMRSALQEMNDTHAFGKTELHIGVGINTGEMVVGNIGGSERVDYTVIGDSVNLGSRMEGLTKEYGVDIIISERTVEQAGSEVLVRRLDKASVKGKKEPVVLYEAIALMSQATEAEKKLVIDFEQALDAYFARDFTGATSICARILKKHPHDGPTKLLLNRCAAFIQDPPPASWNGVWVHTKK